MWQFASILLVVSGVMPKLFNSVAAVQWATPIFILGPKLLDVKWYSNTPIAPHRTHTRTPSTKLSAVL